MVYTVAEIPATTPRLTAPFSILTAKLQTATCFKIAKGQTGSKTECAMFLVGQSAKHTRNHAHTLLHKQEQHDLVS